MTEESKHSNTASHKATPESSSPEELKRRMEGLAKRQQEIAAEHAREEPQPIGANIQKIKASWLERSEKDPGRDADVEAMWQAEQDRKSEAVISRLLEKSCLPRRHLKLEASPEGVWGEKFNCVMALLGKGSLIALTGPRGTGKTQMAVQASIKWCLQEHSILYTTAMDVFIAIKESYRPNGPSESEQLRRFRVPSLLVIDEAHVRGETDWENNMLTHLVDSRYMNGRDTIIISNQMRASFRDSVGESIYSRLIETGGVIECNWKSFRTTTDG